MRLMAQDGGHMQNGLSLAFERTLYQAVIRYKLDHPGELEAITKRRKEREKNHERNNLLPQTPGMERGRLLLPDAGT